MDGDSKLLAELKDLGIDLDDIETQGDTQSCASMPPSDPPPKPVVWTEDLDNQSWDEVEDNDILQIVLGGVASLVAEVRESTAHFFAVPISYHFRTSSSIVNESLATIGVLRREAEGTQSIEERRNKLQRTMLARYVEQCNKRKEMPDRHRVDKFCREIKHCEDGIARTMNDLHHIERMERRLQEANTRKELYRAMSAVIVLAGRASGGDVDRLEAFREMYDDATDNLQTLSDTVDETMSSDLLETSESDSELRDRIMAESNIHPYIPIVKRTETNKAVVDLPKAPTKPIGQQF